VLGLAIRPAEVPLQLLVLLAAATLHVALVIGIGQHLCRLPDEERSGLTPSRSVPIRFSLCRRPTRMRPGLQGSSLSAFLQEISALPTGIFTIMLMFVVVYWVVFLFGFLDLDALGGAHGGGAADGALDGATEGAADAVGHGHDLGDGHDGHGHDADGHGEGLLATLGLRTVPVTVAWSLVSLLAWTASILMMRGFGSGWSPWAAGPVIGVAALVCGLVGAGVCTRPMRRLFERDRAPTNLQLVGQVCRITTTRVDAEFGQGAIKDKGAEILIQVRSRDPNLLVQKDEALIIDYDTERRVFYVEAMARLLPPTDPRA
jgi:hypothetical protein